MNDAVGIEKTTYFLPENIVSSKELADLHDFSEDFILSKIGVSQKRVSGDEQTSGFLAIQAVKKLVEQGQDATEIDIIILITQTPDYILPPVSYLLHKEFGFRKNIPVLDINMGCSGYLYGLSTIKSMMKELGLSKGLLVTTDTYNKIIDPSDRATSPIFGDGASASLISNNPLYNIGKATFQSNGEGFKHLTAGGVDQSKDRALHMNGRQVFSYVLKNVPKNIKDCLELNGLEKRDVQSWVFHQASKYMLEELSKELELDQSEVVIDLLNTGNLTSSSIPVALANHVFNQDKYPKRIVLSGFGVGLSIATTVLERKE